MMSKKIKILLIVLTVLVVVVLALSAYIFLNPQTPSGGGTRTPNPVANLSDEEAAQQFDASFVRYLLYEIDAEKLHEPPLSKNTPKIEIRVDEEIYFAEVIDNSIKVSTTSSADKDIVIRTSKTEAIKMLRDRNYVSTSFRNGDSSIELVASETTLFSKGYLKLYETFKA